jgi:hypothetical protein
MKRNLGLSVKFIRMERSGFNAVLNQRDSTLGGFVRYIILAILAWKMYPIDTFEPECDAQTPTNIWRTETKIATTTAP